ncbi:hypothetical protein F4776DRAFT_666939 [Hypoxylon sp. NC0597]|nr:hypothetical protein F4776DRAFT_666939 [Hypoxylon sp. NC0597]
MRRITRPSYLRYSKEPQLSRVPLISHFRLASSQPRSHQEELHQNRDPKKQASEEDAAKARIKKKTMAELDAELQQKMSGISGDGGEAGVEYEDGKPVAMKRSVKNLRPAALPEALM